MKKLFYLPIFLCALLLFNAPPAHAQGTTDHAGWNKVFDSIAANNPLPAFYVACVDKKGISYHYGHGNEVWTATRPLDENSIFRIYSMTKPLTAVAMMQLVEQGKIKLDDPLTKWLPEMEDIPILKDDGTLVKASKPITLRQLLTHTSGFAYNFFNAKLAKFKKPTDWKYKDYPRIFEPGEGFYYGTSLDWVGKLVEKISGESLEAYFEKHICKPLGMDRTFFTVPDSLMKNIVSFGELRGDKFYNDTAERLNRSVLKPKEFSGGGGLFSTVHDYACFVQCILNNGTLNGKRILKRQTIDTMGVNQIGNLWIAFDGSNLLPYLTDKNARGIGRDKMGIGFAVAVSGTNGAPPGSLYWGGVANTAFNINRKQGRAMLFFANVLPFGTNYAESIYFKAEELFYK
jgi:methyl acetate hydrolase